MGIEIERKFTVDPTLLRLDKGTHIKQGYLPSANQTAMRIRIADQRAFLTIKGANKGAIRSEFEYPIPISDAHQIIDELCQRPFIEKKRYIVNVAGNQWEIDVFEGDNRGLVMAEIELESESQQVEIPSWAIKEVTGDPRYYNSNLIRNPYKDWIDTV
jgi:adenylate cyclase